MKQLKFIITAAIVALTVNSCSSDRDDEVKKESTGKVELKPLKIESNNQETAKTGDTVIIGPNNGTSTVGLEPDPDPNPNDPEIIPPGDIKPPKP